MKSVSEGDVRPSAPSRFTEVEYAEGVLTLRWEDSSTIEEGYTVEGSTEEAGDIFAVVSQLPANATEFSVATESPGRYQVAAFKREYRSDALTACLAYEDLDADGFGTYLRVWEGGCPAEGGAFEGGDCDDEDAGRFPGNPDICDGTDNDCDNIVDLGTWYRDSDGDGYGDPLLSSRGCSAPPDYVPLGDDCDDEDHLVVPAGKDSGCFRVVRPSIAPRGFQIGACAMSTKGIFYHLVLLDRFDAFSTVVEWDPFSGIVKERAELDTFLPLLAACVGAPDGRIVCLGGIKVPLLANGDEIVEFDPASGAFLEAATKLPSARSGASCSLAEDGIIFCFGGVDEGGAGMSDILRYNSTTGEVATRSARLSPPRSDLSCAVSRGGRIHCFGGRLVSGLGEPIDEILEYDPVGDRVAVKSSKLPTSRYGLACAGGPQGKIYCFGGQDWGSSEGVSHEVLEYDTSTDSIRTLVGGIPKEAGPFLQCSSGSNGRIYCCRTRYQGWSEGQAMFIEFFPPVGRREVGPRGGQERF